MRYFKDVKCLRLREDKLRISWRDEGISLVKIFLINNDEEILIEQLKGGSELVIKDPNKRKRNLFILKAEGYQSEVVAETLIPFKGVHHFRDIGGYKSEDGRRVKWNTFFRADKLSSLTVKDIEYFKALGIRTILDLRSPTEVKSMPDPKIDGIDYINISGMPELDETKDNFDMMSIFKLKSSSDFDATEFLMKGYKTMVFNNPAYKELVDCIENEERVPIVFHCSAGKDRTGFGAALILSILGVSEETIMEDYLLTNIYRKPINDKTIEAVKDKISNPKHLEVLKVMLEVKKELLEASFKSIRGKYGNMDTYLEKEYGLTKKKRKEIKNRFLY
ncbi:tyrosine-protein phosphatase [Clostridium paraputrificum]|uniref:tyrosine-protein phosphatase n=1 Tax=Clostridium paraputrificum TaxID=29363 RepID=UPI003D328322